MKRYFLRWSVAALTVVALSHVGQAEAKALRVALPPKPAMQAVQAEVIVLGKISEIEKDTVEATPYKGAPKEQKVAYKIAVLKIEDPLIGARGLTQIRIGFQAEAAVPAAPVLNNNQQPQIAIARRPIRPGFGPVALTAGMEGVFLLTPHHDGDFYVAVNNGAPLLKKDDNYAKELETIKKIAGAIDDPILALKSKDKADRALAAQSILTRYRGRPINGKVVEEDLPAEENKLLVDAVAELPWTPEGNDYTKPSRSVLWNFLQPEKLGFKQPVFKQPVPGAPAPDFNKQWEEATNEFLKANADKIKIKKLVAAK
ncbi:hypothetical protein [Zavarzinella formosa]|uniref:hypothetical protein n=1 Tax=Zavarzinella formosa TaxID=360055 RepID=UPI0012F9BBAC|nr:hypothetical protein [Zavarzinella formosa]